MTEQTTEQNQRLEQQTESKPKVPSQFFQWFDSLKQSYENSINKLFNRVEQVNEDHKKQIKTVYQDQISELKKSYQDHLQSMRTNHQQQTDQAAERIRQLEKDAQFYQDQLKRQNQTIDKLNDRYDTVIFALKDKLDDKEIANVIKDISPSDQPSLPDSNTETNPSKNKSAAQDSESQPQAQKNATDDPIVTTETKSTTTETKQKPQPTQTENSELEQVLNNAFVARQDKHFEHAYELFYVAAQQGSEKAMGAIGRAHFVGEGVLANKAIGLAWLIKAAEHNFEPAIKKVASAKEKSPELYNNALEISKELLA